MSVKGFAKVVIFKGILAKVN